MLWWDWNWKQKLLLLWAMLVLAALPCATFGWLQAKLGAFFGGVAFLTIPQIVGWNLFVGLRTGRIPSRGTSERRAESPFWFWTIAACYAAILILYLGFLAIVLMDSVPGR